MGLGWDEIGGEGMGQDGMGWDGDEDGRGWDGIGWGWGWNGMGWDRWDRIGRLGGVCWLLPAPHLTVGRMSLEPRGGSFHPQVADFGGS